MKVTYNWLGQYVEIPWSPEVLADKLTMLGLEVESIVTLSGEFEGVVVAQILSSEKHPNADKLSICKVADGKGERQIVCGATNYKVGDKVPLALPGCTLPASAGSSPFTIKVSKMRGVESQGMMCSAKELQLAEDAEGLLILPADASIGQPLAGHLGRSGGDVVFDLEITPNRPDWNSVIGIAREISALLGTSLRLPNLDKEEADPQPITGFVNLRVEEPELCPRYVARVIRGVKVKPSPAWLQGMVEKVGLRSINNIVDVTNYVMLETGQPLHAFDLRLLEKAQSHTPETHCSVVPTLVVRKARPGEKFKTLDGVERPLNAEMLLIADEQKALAVAGIMGGLNSEIQESTQEVLLESAAFKSQSIRQTSKTLELRTEASYRFERGSDLAMVEWASRRAAQLIAEVSGGVILKGSLDACALPPSEQTIRLRHFKVGELLGLEIDPALQTAYLTRLGLELIQGDIPESEAKISWALKSEQTTPKLAHDELPQSTSVKLRVPSFRQDLKGEADLIEEIARLHGIDKIPSTPPRGAIGSHPFDLRHDSIMEVRQHMAALGLYEVQGQTLIHERDCLGPTNRIVDSRIQPSEREPALASLKNPLNSEMGVLRPSLLPGLLQTLRHNVNRQLQDLAFFEVGRVFQPDPKEIREEWRLAVALTGKRELRFWEGKEKENLSTIYDLKGILEEFFDHQGLRGISFQSEGVKNDYFIEFATILLGKNSLGIMGQLQPAMAKQYDLRNGVYLAELNLDHLVSRRPAEKSFKALPQFPSIRRDVAILLKQITHHEEVLALIRTAKPAFLETVEIFDVYRGTNIPEGQKSMAYTFIYRGAERTLTDAEVNEAHEKIIAAIKEKLSAIVREG